MLPSSLSLSHMTQYKREYIFVYSHAAVKNCLRLGNLQRKEMELTHSSTGLGRPQETYNYGGRGSKHVLLHVVAGRSAEQRRKSPL